MEPINCANAVAIAAPVISNLGKPNIPYINKKFAIILKKFENKLTFIGRLEFPIPLKAAVIHILYD